MKDVAIQSAKEPHFKNLVKKYKLKNNVDDLEKVFNYAFYNTYFQGDNSKTQTIRTGLRSIGDKRANCVDYCILISSLLQNMKVPHRFRMISTDRENPNNLSHIYVVTANGETLDPVLGQDQSGNEYLKRDSQRTPNFLMQAPYVSKSDLKIF